MLEIIKTRIIRPSSRKDTSDRYKIDTSKVNIGDCLVVIIHHETKPFTKTYSSFGSDLKGKKSIHFAVSENGNQIDIKWSGAQPISNHSILSNQRKVEKKNPFDKIIPSFAHKQSFKPIADSNSKVLVLGTMPGELSLAKQEYYAHSRNLFWKIIATVTENQIPATYSEKKELLLRSKIAVWDVCDICLREGSLDSAIQEEAPNDIETFLKKHPSIKTIAFNGSKAAALFNKYFTRKAIYKYLTLPSTSPANGGDSFDNKMKLWIAIKE